MDEFWNSNPRILRIYINALQEKNKLLDEQMWAMGHYVVSAVYVAVGRLFAKNFQGEYPEQPFSAPQRTIEEIEEAEAEKQMRRMIAAENAWVIQGKMRGLPENK